MTDQTQTTTEPVAWLMEDLILPSENITRDGRYAQRMADYRYEGEPTYKVTPLYTTPQPLAIGLDRDVRERLQAAVADAESGGRYDHCHDDGSRVEIDTDDLRSLLALSVPAEVGEVERVTTAFNDAVSLSWHRYSLARDLGKALTWALAEIDGETQYENDAQRQNCRDKADEVVRAIDLAAPAEGYVLVPVEPTEAMWRAAEQAFDRDPEVHHETVISNIWADMLGALPAAPTGGRS